MARFLPSLRDKALKGMSNTSVMVPLLKLLLSLPCTVTFVILSSFQPEPTISTCVFRISLPSQMPNTLCNHLMVCWRMFSSNLMNMSFMSSASLNILRFQRPFLPYSHPETMVVVSTSYLEPEMPITCSKKSSSKKLRKVLLKIMFYCIAELTLSTLMANIW